MEIYKLFAYFIIYGTIGWATEVVFAGFKERRFVNRGFLNGPICPIYGIGVTLVVTLVKPFSSNILSLYLVSTIVVTLVELITGFLMDKLFHHKWWDYTGMPLSIGGYICLPFSFIWGIACVLIVKVIHPIFERFVNWIPNIALIIVMIVLVIVLLVDISVTYVEVLRLNRQLESMTKIAKDLHAISDRIGINIFERVQDTFDLQEKLSHINAEQKERILNLRVRYREAMSGGRIRNRLINAFPTMQSRKYKDSLDSLRKRLKEEVDKRNPRRNGN
ncbi:MAG: putative ABC transporter permease [Suipraeoptans sp.]